MKKSTSIFLVCIAVFTMISSSVFAAVNIDVNDNSEESLGRKFDKTYEEQRVASYKKRSAPTTVNQEFINQDHSDPNDEYNLGMKCIHITGYWSPLSSIIFSL